MMTNKIFVISAILVFLYPPIHGEAKQKHTKPLPPVQVAIAPVQSSITSEVLKPGDIVDLNISAVSHADNAEMAITVDLPSGVDLISGALSIAGQVSKGDRITLPITIRVPQKGGEVKAKATITLPGNNRFSSSARYYLGPEKTEKPAPVHPTKKDSKGQDVIEYR